MSTAASRKGLLRLMNTGTKRLEDQAVKDLKKILTTLTRRARGRVRKREVGSLDFTKKFATFIQRVMVVQHLQGLVNTRRVYNHVVKSLDFYSDTSRALARILQINSGPIMDAYEASAFRVAEEFGDHINRELAEHVNSLIDQQLPTTKMVESLQEKFDALGITPRNSFALENIVRTQSQLAFNAGKYIGEQDPAFQEILWGYEYTTVGDNRVREEHAVLEGVTLPKNDPFWRQFYPPNGWSCRCAVIPVFDEPDDIKNPPVDFEVDERFLFNPGEFLLNQ